jgi:hypothetical protein
MINAKYRAFIHRRPEQDLYEIYLVSRVADNKTASFTIENGVLLGKILDDPYALNKPLFSVCTEEREVFSAIAEALNEAGFKVETDNAETVKQTTLAEERLKQSEYFKNLTEKMLAKKELI